LVKPFKKSQVQRIQNLVSNGWLLWSLIFGRFLTLLINSLICKLTKHSSNKKIRINYVTIVYIDAIFILLKLILLWKSTRFFERIISTVCFNVAQGLTVSSYHVDIAVESVKNIEFFVCIEQLKGFFFVRIEQILFKKTTESNFY